MSESEERLRERPSSRFQGNVVRNNLNKELDRLRKEEMSEGHQEQGHRQVELYRDGGCTVSLFQFEPGGTIPAHSVEDGSVSLQVLEGRLSVTAEGEQQILEEDEILFLQPGTQHALEASEASIMLLTIMRGTRTD